MSEIDEGVSRQDIEGVDEEFRTSDEVLKRQRKILEVMEEVGSLSDEPGVFWIQAFRLGEAAGMTREDLLRNWGPQKEPPSGIKGFIRSVADLGRRVLGEPPKC